MPAHTPSAILRRWLVSARNVPSAPCRRAPAALPLPDDSAAIVPCSAAEIVMPLVLLFSPWPWLTWIGIISMWMLHAFIISTIPLAVPLEWNVFFMFCVCFLFANFPAGAGYGLGDMHPALLVGVVAFALFPIILGAIWPQHVSFLIGLKQYAGNWASTSWSFRDKEKEDRLNERIVKAADNQIDQIEPLFGKEISEIFIQKAIAFRMMHPMGRMHITLHMRHSGDIDTRVNLPVGGVATFTITNAQTSLSATGDIVKVAMAQYLLKTGWEIAMTPVTYRVVAALKRAEDEDFYDRDTNFTPFSLKA